MAKILASNIIVKVQVPLASSQAIPDCLVYDQNRKFVGHIPYTGKVKESLREVLGDRPKGYFYCDVTEEETENFFNLKNEAPEQPW